MARALRRRARADRLPDVAQAPVGARDRTLHRAPSAGHRRPARRSAQRQYRRRTRSSRSPTTTPSTRDLDLIAGVVAGPGDPRRGPAHQELEHARRARVKKIDSPYAIVLTGTPLENRLEELISIVQFVDRYRLGPDVPPARTSTRCATTPGKRGRLPRPRPASARRSRRSCCAGSKERGARPAARADRQDRLRADDAAAAGHASRREPARSSPGSSRKWRRVPASCPRPTSGGCMIALQNMRMSCDSTYLLDQRDRPRRQGRRAGRRCSTSCSSEPERQGGDLQPVAADARADRAGGSKQRGWGHVLFHGGVPGDEARRRWSTASATTRSAGCSCRPTPAASG